MNTGYITPNARIDVKPSSAADTDALGASRLLRLREFAARDRADWEALIRDLLGEIECMRETNMLGETS